jgi:hypothetical protein
VSAPRRSSQLAGCDRRGGAGGAGLGGIDIAFLTEQISFGNDAWGLIAPAEAPNPERCPS